MIGIRSRTKLTEEVFEAADKLMAVGCFSVGTNQVCGRRLARHSGLQRAFSNTRSVAGLVINESLLSAAFPIVRARRTGSWDKPANGSFEVRGKTAPASRQLRASIGSPSSPKSSPASMGMRVIYQDLTDKLPRQHRAGRKPDRLLAPGRRHLAARAGDPAAHMMIGEKEIAP